MEKLGEGDREEFKVFDELFLGDSKMEYNFLTFPLKEFLEKDADPCKVLTEPFRWSELQRLNNGLFSTAAAAAAEELTVNDRLKTADVLRFRYFCDFFPIL